MQVQILQQVRLKRRATTGWLVTRRYRKKCETENKNSDASAKTHREVTNQAPRQLDVSSAFEVAFCAKRLRDAMTGHVDKFRLYFRNDFLVPRKQFTIILTSVIWNANKDDN